MMPDTITEKLWVLSALHKVEADVEVSLRHTAGYNPQLEQYHRGKAFAYEHAARMLEGTDAS